MIWQIAGEQNQDEGHSYICTLCLRSRFEYDRWLTYQDNHDLLRRGR